MRGNRYTLTLLFAITLLGLILRIWGAGHGIADELFTHPDELPFAYEVKIFVSGFFNRPEWVFSPLWVYIHALGVYLYSLLGGALKYLLGMSQSFIEPLDVFRIILIGRVIAGTIGAMTIPIVYLIGKRLLNEKTGMISAGIMAVLYLHVIHSHFAYVDVPQTFFLTLSFYYMVNVSTADARDARRETIDAKQRKNIYNLSLFTRHSFLAGIFLALAIATKINAAPAFISLIFAHYLREKGFKRLVKSKYLYTSIFGLILGYGLCTPWHFIKPMIFLESLRGILNLLYSPLSLGAVKYAPPLRISEGIKDLSRVLFEQIGIHLILLFSLALVIIVIRKEWKVLFVLSFPLVYLPFFVLANWHDQREIIPIIPFFVIVMAYGLSRAVDVIPFKRKGAVMFLLSLLFIFPSLWKSLKADYFIWQRDTRVLAADWIRENLPWDARIGIEGDEMYTVPIYNERYRLNAELSKIPINELKKEVDFAVISSIIYDNSSPKRKLYYDKLRENTQRIKVFKTYSGYFSNPKIEIYRLTRKGESFASIVPRTYSEKGPFAISFGEGQYGKESLSFSISTDLRIKRLIISEKKLDQIGIFLYNGSERSRLKVKTSFKGKKITLDPYEKRAIVFEPFRSFPFTKYIYDISISSRKGGGEVFVNILTDPKRIANALIESGDWEQAISILSKRGQMDKEGWSLLGLAYSIGEKYKDALESFRKGLSPSATELLNCNEWKKTFESFANIDSAFLTDSLAVEYGVDKFQQQAGRKMDWMAHFDPRFDMPGFVLFGPYKRLPRGHFNAVFKIRTIPDMIGTGGHDNRPAARVDVFNGDSIIAERVIRDTRGRIEEFSLGFYNDEPDRKLEFRVEALGGRELWVEEIKVFPDIQGHYKWFLGMVHHYWGLSAGNMGLREEAAEHFRGAGLLGYKETEGLYKMAGVYEKMGMKEEAVRAYREILNETPNHKDSLLALRRLISQGAAGLDERIRVLTPEHDIRQGVGDIIEFMGYSIDKERVSPGGGFMISYFWHPLKKIRANYSIFVHFRKDGATVFQNDRPPSMQTNRWKMGSIVKEGYRVDVPPDAPAGRYDIIIGLWDPEGTKERVKLKDQKMDELKIGSIEVSATP